MFSNSSLTFLMAAMVWLAALSFVNAIPANVDSLNVGTHYGQPGINHGHKIKRTTTFPPDVGRRLGQPEDANHKVKI